MCGAFTTKIKQKPFDYTVSASSTEDDICVFTHLWNQNDQTRA